MTDLLNERVHTVAIIGGGFTGAIALANLVRILSKEACRLTESGKSLRVVWFDKDNAFSRGLAYSRQSAADQQVFILNQPAYAMSPFAQEPDLYVRWLARHHPECNDLSFTPRSIYGAFIEQTVADHEQRASLEKLPISICRSQSEVTDVSVVAGRLVLSVGSGDVPVFCDSVLLSSGHQLKDDFKKLRSSPGCIANPYDLNLYRQALTEKGKAGTAVLVGGGPTTIDAVRALEHAGFAGRYEVISSSPALPWAQEPALYRDRPVRSYRFAHLTPKAVTGGASLGELRRLLREELKHAACNGFGPGHVYYGLDLSALFGDGKSLGEGARAFLRQISYLKGAVTAPENCLIYSRLRRQRRITRRQGRAQPENARYCPHSRLFRVPMKRLSGGLDLVHGQIFINCSQLLKSLTPPFASELLSNLTARGLIKVTDDALIGRGVDSGAPVFPLGPLAKPPDGGPRTVWGVETFREEIRAVTEELVKSYVQDRAVSKIQGGS